MKPVLTIVLCAVGVWGQTPASPADLLARFRERMLETLGRQPNYTCLETVERSRQAPRSGLQMKDVLRLEVALVDNKEMFAWPGSKEFEDKDLREIVATGMFGNGNYGLYSRMLFGGRGPTFEYRDEVQLGGGRAVRYDFRVERGGSGYELRVDNQTARVGFHGSIYVDPATADLRRLEVFADDIPPELGLTAAEDRVDYTRVAIGDEKFLLPVESALLMASKDVVSRNRVRFSGCRKFAGDSSLVFDESELQERVEASAVQEVVLAPNTSLQLEIRSDIRLDNAAVGDLVTAVLTSDVKNGKTVLVPKGASAAGRILTLEHFEYGSRMKIEFTEIEWPGGHASFRARFERVDGIMQPARRFSAEADGTLRIAKPLLPRSLRGELWGFRTVN